MPLRTTIDLICFCLHRHKRGSFWSTVKEKPDKRLYKDEQKKQLSTRPIEGALQANSRILVSSLYCSRFSRG